MDETLLDTDVLSEVIKRHDPTVKHNAAQYLQAHGQFAFSALTRFEVERGYKEKNAAQQLARFATFCNHSLVLAITDPILHRAGDLWAFARQHGHPHGDADVIIAATALELQRVLVTGNSQHFSWVAGLRLTNWRNP
ncbi:MAG TPA: type II toxin-antitoxin system VapC family toxin [Pirellulales bacterium]